MPQALPIPYRQAIVERHLQGQPLGAIARDLHLSYHTVRQLWRRYRDWGPEGLRPDYPNCGRSRPRGAADDTITAACTLKGLHPTWGAPLIRLELARTHPDAVVPGARTLQRAFRRAGVHRPRHPRRHRPEAPKAQHVHETWQVDAVEKKRLANGHLASWMTVTDEASGAILAAELSPPGAVARD